MAHRSYDDPTEAQLHTIIDELKGEIERLRAALQEITHRAGAPLGNEDWEEWLASIGGIAVAALATEQSVQPRDLMSALDPEVNSGPPLSGEVDLAKSKRIKRT